MLPELLFAFIYLAIFLPPRVARFQKCEKYYDENIEKRMKWIFESYSHVSITCTV